MLDGGIEIGFVLHNCTWLGGSGVVRSKLGLIGGAFRQKCAGPDSKRAKTRHEQAKTCRNITKTRENERFFRIFCDFQRGENRFDWRRAGDEWG